MPWQPQTEGNTVRLKLSILDQSPVGDAETASEAFQHTIELATMAEAWGYHRFWVSEHHGSSRVMGSSPEVLIAHLLAKTRRIRVGSGGVMLQHYSPYKVAENFNVLASLAPGRVDLGIGRGPGGLPRSTTALQQDVGPGATPLTEKLLELEQFLHHRLGADHPLHGLQASPLPSQPAELFLLGTSASSAELAASLGMPYVFALFLNRDTTVMYEAVATYRKRFDTSNGTQPQVLLALPVMVADTDQEALQSAADMKMVRIRLQSGRTLTLGTLEAAEEFGRQSGEHYTIEMQEADIIHGSLDTVRKQLCDLQRLYEVEELIIVTTVRDFPKRLRSYALLSTLLHHA
jgi:luciferase family oxidoreductase group 1